LRTSEIAQGANRILKAQVLKNIKKKKIYIKNIEGFARVMPRQYFAETANIEQ
jgi:hypothetical protein